MRENTCILDGTNGITGKASEVKFKLPAAERSTRFGTSKHGVRLMENDSVKNSDVEMLLPFLREDRRSRWRELFPRPKGRKKLLGTLWNGDDLDRNLLIKVDPSERTIQQLSSRLRSLGAPTMCHLISARANLDGKDLDLISALRMVLNLAPGTIICCLPGKLAYYENDDRNGNYILLGPGVTPRRTTETR